VSYIETEVALSWCHCCDDHICSS